MSGLPPSPTSAHPLPGLHVASVAWKDAGHATTGRHARLRRLRGAAVERGARWCAAYTVSCNVRTLEHRFLVQLVLSGSCVWCAPICGQTPSCPANLVRKGGKLRKDPSVPALSACWEPSRQSYARTRPTWLTEAQHTRTGILQNLRPLLGGRGATSEEMVDGPWNGLGPAAWLALSLSFDSS